VYSARFTITSSSSTILVDLCTDDIARVKIDNRTAPTGG
jgi:hypothetical protein